MVNLQDGLATPVIRALGGQVNAPADTFDDVVYNNFNSTNDIENYGFSGQLDFDLSDAFTLTSITAFRETDAVTMQDSDFTSADLIYPNFQDLDIGTFTQELRLTGEIGDRIDLLLGAFYISEDIDQQNQLIYGSQFRPYANILVQQLSGCARCHSPADPGYAAPSRSTDVRRARRRPPATSAGSSPPGRASTKPTRSTPRPISLFGQVDFEIIDGLVLTLGGNYTDDSKTFVTNAVSSDVFSGINLDAPQYAPLPQHRCCAAARWRRASAPRRASAARRPPPRSAPSPRPTRPRSARSRPARPPSPPPTRTTRRPTRWRRCARCSSCRRSSTCPTRSRTTRSATTTSATRSGWPTTSATRSTST